MNASAPKFRDTSNDFFFLRHLQTVQGKAAKYYNHRFLGRGGNGTAFLVTCAEGSNAGTQMVLKVFHKVSDETRRNAFDREVATLKRLDHSAIVRVLDDGVFNLRDLSYPFVLMEYVPVTVRQLLVTRQVDRLQAIRIVMNCLSALCHIHKLSSPIVHRDIKPENILLGESGAKLADFGLAKELEELGEVDDTAEIESLPADGEEVPSYPGPTQWPGMPRRYRTPELVARAQDSSINLTPASDVYQLGTVFYELLTYFNPQKPTEDLHSRIQLDLRPISGALGTVLLGLITDMLRDRPEDRPSAVQCLARLDQLHRDYCASMTWILGNPS